MRSAPFLAAVAFLLAGCSSSGGSGDEQAIEELFEPTEVGTGKGIIRGIVLDPAITPVEGALVKVTGGPEQQTDANGIFQFNDMDPGTYFVEASKPGWTKVQASADVQADVAEPDILKIAIERIPGSEPRAETMSVEGYISCSIGTPATIHDCNTIEEQKAAVFLPIDGLPTLIQTEIIWESTQAAGDWLYIIQGICECGGSSIASSGERFDETPDATSPYIARATGDFLEGNDAGGENAELGIDVSASGPEPETTNGSGVALNQRFQVFATFFYNLEPDPEWSFVEDGPYPVPSG